MGLSEMGTAGTRDPRSGAPQQRTLVAAADVALRTTLGSAIHAPHCDGEVAGPRLRHAVRDLCNDAHRRGAHAEDVIIAVKQAWASLAELTAQPGEPRRAEILRHFITVCIDEFYAGQSRPGGSA